MVAASGHTEEPFQLVGKSFDIGFSIRFISKLTLPSALCQAYHAGIDNLEIGIEGLWSLFGIIPQTENRTPRAIRMAARG